ncbi:hypothetical protein ABIA35_005982 [Catenulispora sp. MAP12-49]|uniref:uracil-DNA glycosylase family protein n=1 Tax=unclassified Catenulispora TaxID=414885 RepID=UPI003515B2FC
MPRKPLGRLDTDKLGLDRFAALVPGELAGVSGRVFYSGRDAFSSMSPLYLLGLNPGGDPDAYRTETIGRHPAEVASHPGNWSAYRDEAWCGGEPGTWGLQPRVLHLLRRLSLDPGEVASSNLVFARSQQEASLTRRQLLQYADACWPFHQAVIESLQVRAVVCFGQTAGSYVRRRLHADRQCGEFVETNNRGWTSRAHAGEGGVNVVTVTHPSRTDWCNPAADISDLVSNSLS